MGVGVTKYRKLQYKMVRDHHRRSTTGVMASSNPTPLEPLQINLFGRKYQENLLEAGRHVMAFGRFSTDSFHGVPKYKI